MKKRNMHYIGDFVIPAILAVIPAIRQRRGKGVFSVPYLLLMGALLLLQHLMTRKNDKR